MSCFCMIVVVISSGVSRRCLRSVFCDVQLACWCAVWVVVGVGGGGGGVFFFLRIRRPPRSTLDRSSAASDVYKRQPQNLVVISTWFGLGDWRRWHASRDRQDFETRIRQHLSAPERVRVLLEGLTCLLYTSPSPRDRTRSHIPSSA